jgi:ElaB/YqjD/DUF883 family membrane-anchored ribosome-binding protein
MSTRTEKLLGNLKSAATHAEELIESTAGQLTEKSKEARTRLNDALESAQRSCEELQERAVAGLKTAEDTIKAHPYKTVGIALGVGLLVGLLLTRRD